MKSSQTSLCTVYFLFLNSINKILALGFFMNCTWPPKWTVHSILRKTWRVWPWWDQDEPRNVTDVHSSGQYCSMNNSGFSGARNVTSSKRKLLFLEADKAHLALPSHFSKVTWFRICLTEISGRILAIQGYGAIPFSDPLLSHCCLLNFASCEPAAGHKPYFYWA